MKWVRECDMPSTGSMKSYENKIFDEFRVICDVGGTAQTHSEVWLQRKKSQHRVIDSGQLPLPAQVPTQFTPQN